MDIKAKIDEIVKKVKADPKLLESFKKDPEKTVEGLIGVDIPDGAIDKVVAGVKAAIAGGKLSEAADAIKKMF